MLIEGNYIDLQYFGAIKSFLSLINQTNCNFLPSVAYQKSLHLNRARLVGANGPLLLTVPLIGGRDKKQVLRDVQISYTEPWQRTHWRGIQSAYRKSPWFEDYAPGMEQLFKRREKFLLDLNLKTTQWALDRMKLKIAIMAETENLHTGKHTTDIQQFSVSTELHYPAYQQVFADRFGFIPNLSILDLLFCKGPQSAGYLHSIHLL
ncbi:MAG: WbqC family protein [Chitinophagaceae bacterium]|nr:WbqC family protein [Chitinophagaceae bacterium]